MKRARTERRERERALDKATRSIARAVDQVAATSPGGSIERAIEVSSPAATESRVRNEPCHRCRGPLDLTDERVEFHAGRQFRRFEVSCRKCRTTRRLWFVLGPATS